MLLAWSSLCPLMNSQEGLFWSFHVVFFILHLLFLYAQVPSTLQFLQDKLITHYTRSNVLMAAALSSAALHCVGTLVDECQCFGDTCCLSLWSTRVFCIPHGPARLFPSTLLSEVKDDAQNVLHTSQSLFICNSITQFKCCSVQHKLFLLYAFSCS